MPSSPKKPDALLEARLITPLSSYHSHTGDVIVAAVETQACAADGSATDGAEILGTVKDVHKVGLGLIHETAKLELAFKELRFPDGRTIPVSARVVDVDNARERIDRKGAIHGIRATATLSNRAGERLAFETLEHPFLLGPVFALETMVLPFPEPEIAYGSGTELLLSVDGVGELKPCTGEAKGPTSEQAAQLSAMVDTLPYWTRSKRQPQAMDPINLVYLGSRESLESAFAAAGWGGSVPNSVRAGVKAVSAIARESVYFQAPMRTLLLDGAEPQFRLQKSLDTFAKRHHLRVWQREDQISGEAVWAAAATRDTGVTFSLRPFGFTHKVEQPVDLERDKVVRDLSATGCVDWVSYLDRPAPPPETGIGPRETKSDFRLAVVALNACEAPAAQLIEPTQPRLTVRLIRRVTLTARNHLIRANIFYRSGDAARMGFLGLYHWYKGRPEARKQQTEPKTALAN